MSELILHHYWPSPAAEKVRAYLGFKDATWRSVEIPRVPPKPDVVALTGGYRRTPVLQVGADIYCDTQCILRELDRRFPDQPTATAAVTGSMRWGLSRWTDEELFKHCIRVVLGSQIESLDPVFLADRARLYFGPQWTAQSMAAGVAQSLDAIQGSFHWIDQAVADRTFLNGEAPGVVDALCHYPVWFLHGRYEHGPALIAQYDALSSWFERTRDFGCGTHSDLSSAEAIDVARAEGLTTDLGGETVTVVPQDNGGDPEVRGQLLSRTHEEIVLLREDERAGVVRVHFPAVGYCLQTV